MTKPLTPDQKKYGAILRGLGFTRDKIRALDCVTWEREEPHGCRRLEVQLWKDGMYRVSSTVRAPQHAHDRAYGRCTATPTRFNSGLELLQAIAHQQTVEHRNVAKYGTLKILKPEALVGIISDVA